MGVYQPSLRRFIIQPRKNRYIQYIVGNLIQKTFFFFFFFFFFTIGLSETLYDSTNHPCMYYIHILDTCPTYLPGQVTLLNIPRVARKEGWVVPRPGRRKRERMRTEGVYVLGWIYVPRQIPEPGTTLLSASPHSTNKMQGLSIFKLGYQYSCCFSPWGSIGILNLPTVIKKIATNPHLLSPMSCLP